MPSAMFIDMTSRVDTRSYQGCVAILRGRFILMYVRTYVMSLSGVDCSYVVKHILTKTVSIGVYTLSIVCRNLYVCVCLL